MAKITNIEIAEPRLPAHPASEFESTQRPVDYAPATLRDEADVELPVERAKLVEQGLIALQQTNADRDWLRRQNASLKTRIAELEATLTARDKHEHVIESRVRDCLRQADDAVKDAAEVRGVLSSLAAILVGYYKPKHHDNGEPEQTTEQDQP
jgi:hypothetical protein